MSPPGRDRWEPVHVRVRTVLQELAARRPSGPAASDPAAYLEIWPSHASRRAFLMDREQRLLWANARFHALDRASPLRGHEGSLVFNDRNQQSDFGAFVAGLDEAPAAWVLKQPEGGFLLLRCMRLTPEDSPPAIACAVHDSQERGQAVWADFGQVFGLTAAEALLARRLADGELLANVTASLGITQETAKTHLRRVYAKLGVGSREEFYARLLPFRLT